MYGHPCVSTPTQTEAHLKSVEEQDEIFEVEEGRCISRVAKEASINAINDTFSLGRHVMTLQNGSIVRKYPDGRTETVQKIKKMPIIPERRIYHL